MATKKLTEELFDIESVFLHEVITGYRKYKYKARELKERGENYKLALEYAEAYKVLINKFSQLENETFQG